MAFSRVREKACVSNWIAICTLKNMWKLFKKLFSVSADTGSVGFSETGLTDDNKKINISNLCSFIQEDVNRILKFVQSDMKLGKLFWVLHQHAFGYLWNCENSFFLLLIVICRFWLGKETMGS